MLIATPRTDFNQFAQQQLLDMLSSADVTTVRRIAEGWDQVGALLHELADAIERETSQFGHMWAGTAASQYERMMSDLVTAERKLAAHCWAVRDVIHDAGDALETAQAQMPAAVSVPELSPSTVALATTPLQMMDVSSPEAMLALQQRQSTAVAAVQAQQQAVAQASAAQTQAAQVMTTLADNYTTESSAIPETPLATASTATGSSNGLVATPLTSSLDPNASGTVPVSLTDPSSSGLIDGLGGIGTAADGTGVGTSPLFGDLVTAGLAAAAAASTGRFGLGMPQVPGFARPGGSGRTTHPGGSTPGTDPKALPNAAGAPGGLGGGGSIPGLGGGGGLSGLGGGTVGTVGGVAAPAAAGFGQLATASPMASSASALGSAAQGVGAAPASSSGMPMGAMPMGGMGGMGGDSGSRRVPQWLVETEDVWGESSAVAPTSIGEV